MSEELRIDISAVALQVTGVALATAAGAITAMAANRLSVEGQRALGELTAGLPTTLERIAPASVSPTISRSTARHLPAEEARVVTELVSAAPLAVGDSRRLEHVLRAAPIEKWPTIIKDEHDRLFRRTLTEAICRACRTLDFSAIRSAGNQLVAEDRHGRALAVEVGDEGAVRAEVLGIADGTCHAVVDRFLRALEDQGVRIAKVRDRRWTGGAPTTEAGRRWATRQGSRRPAAPRGTASDRHVKRAPDRARIRR